MAARLQQVKKRFRAMVERMGDRTLDALAKTVANERRRRGLDVADMPRAELDRKAATLLLQGPEDAWS